MFGKGLMILDQGAIIAYWCVGVLVAVVSGGFLVVVFGLIFL